MKKLSQLLIILLVAGVLYAAYTLFGARIARSYYSRAAEQAISASEPGRAADLYSRVLASYPRDEALRLRVSELYVEAGNFSRAEHTLFSGLRDIGPSSALYLRLCSVYVAQGKLSDAVLLLSGVHIQSVKDELDALRPAPPVFSLPGGTYEDRIEITLSAGADDLIYCSWLGEIPGTRDDLYTGPVPLEPGITNARAVAVSPEGLVSDWAECEYTLQNIVDPIQFADPSVERVIRETIGKPDGLLYTEDVWDIESLVWADPAEYTTLSDLTLCKKLKTLHLTGMRGRCDISALSELPELSELHLASFGIDAMDLDWVGRAGTLERLYLPDNNIGSVAPLSGLARLTELDLSQNSILNIEPLSGLAALQYLNLSRNAVQELTALAALKSLTVFLAEENRISFLQGIEGLTSLRQLSISYNPSLVSLREIEGLTSLESVNASHCSLGEESLPAMSKLKKLTELNIAANGIPDLEGLTGLTALRELRCSDNQISSIEPLSVCTALEVLEAAKNGISSVEPLYGLPALYSVNIEDNAITTIQRLKECPSLKYIYAFGNPLTDPINAFDGTGITVSRK